MLPNKSNDSAAPETSTPRVIVRRWWSFPTRCILLVLLFGWGISLVPSLVPPLLQYVAARKTPGDISPPPKFGLQLLQRRVIFDDVEWKHREKNGFPTRVAIKNIDARISFWDLLFRRAVIEHCKINGIEIDANIDEVYAQWMFPLLGKTAPIISANSTSPINSLRKSAPLFGEEVMLMLSGQRDLLTPVLAQNLQTFRIAQTLQMEWAPEFERLKTQAQAIRERIENLRRAVTTFNLQTSIPQLLSEVQTIEADCRQLAAEFEKFRGESAADVQQLQAAWEKDRRTLSSIQPPNLSFDAISEQLLSDPIFTTLRETLLQDGEKILPQVLREFITRAEKEGEFADKSVDKLDAPRESRTPLDWCAQRLDASGQVQLSGTPIYFCAAIRDVGSLPSENPLVMNLCLDANTIPESAAAISSQAESNPLYLSFSLEKIDGGFAPAATHVEKWTLQQPHYVTPEWRLGDESTLGIVIAPMTVKLEASMEKRGEQTTIRLRFLGENASLTPQLSTTLSASPVGQQLAVALAAVKLIAAEVHIEQIGDEQTVSFQSNLSDLLMQGVRSLVSREWNAIRESLVASLESEVTRTLSEATGEQSAEIIKSLNELLTPLLQSPGLLPFSANSFALPQNVTTPTGATQNDLTPQEENRPAQTWQDHIKNQLQNQLPNQVKEKLKEHLPRESEQLVPLIDRLIKK